MPFWVCDSKPEKSSFHRFISDREGLLHHEITVKCRPFSAVLAEFGVPRYLKMDIEANEIHCLHDLSPADLPEYVSIEKSGYEKQELKLLREKFVCSAFAYKLPSNELFTDVVAPLGQISCQKIAEDKRYPRLR